MFFVGVFVVLAWHSIGIAKTEYEANNIFIYPRVGLGVVNITSIVIERDFFLNPM